MLLLHTGKTRGLHMFFARFIILALVVYGLAGCGNSPLFGGSAEDRAVMAAPAAPIAVEDYKLGVGDIISIRVYDWRTASTPEQTGEDLKIDKVRLDHSGTIVLPFGEFKAVGQTLKQLEGALTNSLRGRLLRNPRVWTNIEEYRPFYIQGQVGRPGAYPFQPGLNVRKAIAIGGGFKERASGDKMFVVREDDKMNSRIRVNLNSPVGPGDTLTVEESLF
jgi:protein involved in polysaccharide export with SLBB domain